MWAWQYIAGIVVALIVLGVTTILATRPQLRRRIFGRRKQRNNKIHAEVITKKYTSLAEVTEALKQAGLVESQLIIGIDYTKSNTFKGKKSFGGKSLHYIDPQGRRLNPYQHCIQLIGKTLERFDGDKVIPMFGFGDLTTKDQKIFGISGCRGDKNFPQGVEEVLQRYNEVTPMLTLAGPTNFAPLIYRAIDIVASSHTFHILLIIADGQVTNENETIQAILKASHYPLSIILVGVGDGPWEMMQDFDDRLPERAFDNFQFVNYTKTCCGSVLTQDVEAAFALEALAEVPLQYKEVVRLKLLQRGFSGSSSSSSEK